jgi:putative drug exporter of the RND superfamily
MPFDTVRWLVSRRPGLVVAVWVVVAVAIGVVGKVVPGLDLTRLAAEGQAHLLPEDCESIRAAEVVRKAWPEQSYESLAVVALYRRGGLTPADRAFARRLSQRLRPDLARDSKPPAGLLRVLGPESPPEVAARLVSRDGTLELLAAQLGTSFVAPSTGGVLDWLQGRAGTLKPPAGLSVLWTGDAIIGRDYMRRVQQSLDRAAVATVFLLLGVLLAVYRSLWLALVPLTTIGVGLVISRGVLAGMARAGWEISPLVELFLVVILFGCGTDFCLFLSWRFGEHWNAANPAGAMRATMRRTAGALVTSAGTVIIGLCLMRTTRFKLFSSTGPSVALGLAITLAACLTLTPSLLILLARYRPRAFAGLTRPSSGFWDEAGHLVLARPVLTWLGTLAVMLPLAVLGLWKPTFIQDLLTELPSGTRAVGYLRLVAEKFGPGSVAPLTVVLEGDRDLRQSEGLALIDDVSRLLAHNRRVEEVRSATQPLGSPEPLEPARLSSRLREIDSGFDQIARGARTLEKGLVEGAAKLRTAIQIEELTGIPLTGNPADPATKDALKSGLLQATGALFGTRRMAAKPAAPTPPPEAERPAKPAESPRELLLRELTRAAEGAGQIADGARRATREVANILTDPVGRRALDRLLITPGNVREHPELRRSFAAYISGDGRRARLDVTQEDRIFADAAMDQVGVLRRRLHDYLSEIDADEGSPQVRALIGGANAESYDVREMTRRDQFQTWIIVPLGVFLVLVMALRDFWACVNLVATMLLTYAFALGATHLLFVTALGAEGIDWKVPYFLFVLLVAVGVDYNVFLMARLQEESRALGLRAGINRAIAQTGGLISSAAAITACSFASFLFSPLGSLRQLGFALVVGIVVDAVLVRPMLVPIGQWLMNRHRERRREAPVAAPAIGPLARVAD